MRMLVFLCFAVLCVWQLWEAVLHRDGSDTLRPVQLFAAVSVFALDLVLCATLLAMLGVYSLLGASAVALLVLAGAKLVLWRTAGVPVVSARVFALLPKSLRRPGAATVAIGLVVAVAGALYALFPTHYLLGGRDYGLYEINAVHVAETGSYQYESDEFYTERYEEARGFAMMAYPALFNAAGQGLTDDVGKLDPQFLPMTSAALALGYGLAGFSGLLRVNAVLSVLCLLTLYFFAARFLGRRTAVLAVLFLALCPAQLWAARITGSEMLAQWLFLLGAYCLALGWRAQKTAWLVCGGALLGVGCFNRIDNYVLLIGLYGVVCYGVLWAPRLVRGLLAAGGVATGLGALSVWYCYRYHHTYFVDHWDTGVLFWLLAGCGAALAFTVLLAGLQPLLQKWKLPNPVALATRRGLAMAVCGVLLALFVYGYFVRPRLGEGFKADSLVEFSWYISALAVPMAVLGLYFLLGGADLPGRVEPLLFLLLCGIGSVVMYTAEPSISSDHFWASRRWVPVNNPFLLLLAAAGVAGLWRAGRGLGPRRWRAVLLRAGAAGAAGGMALYMAWQCRLFVFTTMFAGINGQYAALSEVLPTDQLAVTGDANIASVLKYVYGRPVYIANNTADELKAIHARGTQPLSDTPFSLEAAQRYLNAYGALYVIGSPGRFWQLGEIEQVYDSVLAGSYPAATYGAYPTLLERWEIDVAVYRITPSAIPKSFDFLRGQILGNGATRNRDWSISLDIADTVFYGPYTSLYAGAYRLEMDLECAAGVQTHLKVTLSQGQDLVADVVLEGPGTHLVEFAFDEDRDGLEFALWNLQDEPVTCTRLTLYEQED